MSFLDSLETDMLSLFETINSKANEMTESVKSSLNGLDSDSVRDLFMETNEKVSRMFNPEEETDSIDQPRNGSLVHLLEQNKLEQNNRPEPARRVKKQVTLPHEDSVLSVEEDLPSYDEDQPGYARLGAYVDEKEVCRRVTVTTRKLTEADLDENNPLYCDRETREAQGSPNMQLLAEDESVGEEIVQCLSRHFERFRIMLMESFMEMDLT